MVVKQIKIQLFITEGNNIIWGEEISLDGFEDITSSIDLIMREAYEEIV